MKKIWFIRHGESEANAGLASDDPATIPLTDYGHSQASKLITRLNVKPDLFVVSSYLRTQQTAAPVIAKFHKVPIEVWPLQEYNYLSPQQCINTTAEMRLPWVSEYWCKCDPEYIHGPGAESFTIFSDRIIAAINLLQNRPEEFIVIFTHGQVLRAILQYLFIEAGKLGMKTFRDKMLQFSVLNGDVFICSYKSGSWDMEDRMALQELREI